MRVINLILFLFFLLIACSDTVNGIDKHFYQQSESYAQSLYGITKGRMDALPIDFYDNLGDFLDQTPANQTEEVILKQLIDLQILTSLFIAQEIAGKKELEDTKEQIETIVRKLEDDYKMGIK